MRRALLGMAALIALTAPAVADDTQSDRALRILLAASATPIAARSTCAGDLPDVPRLTIGALVASRLAVFDEGTNRVRGQCMRGACSVSIDHAKGEDVSSAEFRFLTSKGVLIPATLRCVLTP